MNNASRDWFKIFMVIAILTIGANLVYIDYTLFAGSADEPISTVPEIPTGKAAQGPLDLKREDTSVDYDRIYDSINSATASLTLKVNALSQTTGKSSQTAPNPPAAMTREYYIPLGNGSTNSTDWIDLPGVEAYIAPSNYGTISSLYFEAALRIPTGNGQVFARLKNVTDNVPLIESEVSRQGTNAGLVSSGKIPVPTQTKLYRVQLRSSIGADVVIDNGRIKLFAQ